LDASTRVAVELAKPLWNTYEGYIKALEGLANDFEKIRQTADEAKRINKTGKKTLNQVEKTAKKRKKHLDGVIVNVNNEQAKMNIEKNTPVGAIHEENFLEMFGEYLALKDDLEHGEHGELAKEARKPNDSKKEIKRNTKELKKHFKRQQELNKLLTKQEIVKIRDDNTNLTNQLLHEMVDGRMDPAHQLYYQKLFQQLGQDTSNYPFMYTDIIGHAKGNPQLAQQIGYSIPNQGN
jgi:hypothetical protein